MLLPGLRPLWRDRGSVQLGLDPRRAVVLELADPSAAELLDLLDGAHTEDSVVAHAGRLGLSAEATLGILRDLSAAGLIIPAEDLLPAALSAADRERLAGEAGALAHAGDGRSPARVLARRRGQRVVIAGSGRLVTLVGHGLLDAGVGRVARLRSGSRGPRGIVTAAGSSQPVRVSAASLTIDVRSNAAPAPASPRRPVLTVTVREGVVIAGPLVPGTGGPCLRCLDLHRSDLDPQWPSLAAQLPAENAATPCRASTLLTAAGVVVAEALALLDDGEPATIGGCLEIHGPGEIRRRTWQRHPSCDC
jgi:hypothetical protein